MSSLNQVLLQLNIFIWALVLAASISFYLVINDLTKEDKSKTTKTTTR